jgi:hypothetical protein
LALQTLHRKSARDSITLKTLLLCISAHGLLGCGLADALLETGYPPQAVITKSPPLYTQTNEARFEFTCNKSECTFYCLQRDEGQFEDYQKSDFSECKAQHVVPGLSEGEHRILLFTRDLGSRDSAIVDFIWRVDQTAPRTVFGADFTGYVNAQMQGLEFSCDDKSPCTFTCQLENGPIINCSSPLSLENFAEDSENKLTIQSEDQAGNLEPRTPDLTRSIYLDSKAPIMDITDYPGKTSMGRDNRKTLSVSFRTTDVGQAGPERFECQLNSEDVIKDCRSPWEPSLTITATSPSVQPQALRIRAIDAAQNQSEWSQKSWL